MVNGKEIGIVYYRTGYQEEQYIDERDWNVREQIELSMAIKCPSIDMHLLTLKKFQEAFSNEDFLKHVLTEKHTASFEKLKPLF
jgi:glutathione synthase